MYNPGNSCYTGRDSKYSQKPSQASHAETKRSYHTPGVYPGQEVENNLNSGKMMQDEGLIRCYKKSSAPARLHREGKRKKDYG